MMTADEKRAYIDMQKTSINNRLKKLDEQYSEIDKVYQEIKAQENEINGELKVIEERIEVYSKTAEEYGKLIETYQKEFDAIENDVKLLENFLEIETKDETESTSWSSFEDMAIGYFNTKTELSSMKIRLDGAKEKRSEIFDRIGAESLKTIPLYERLDKIRQDLIKTEASMKICEVLIDRVKDELDALDDYEANSKHPP